MKRILVTLLCLVASAVAAFSAETVRAVLPPNARPPSVYKIVEISVQIDGGPAIRNPFDPNEIAVDATFTGPGGRTLRIPGFWAPGWRVRFAPTAPGAWTGVVSVRDKSGTVASPPIRVSVAASQDPGFVRRASNNARYFAFDDGSPYFLIGENVCWPGQRGLADYDDWFGALGKAGGNFARLWMAFTPLESKESGGVGIYSTANAAHFDGVLERASAHGLRCMLALGTYGEFNTGGFFNEGKWPDNPYNKANGGPAAKPDDFFTDATARALYKRRLRYLIARYGAYTSLAFWEFWNEKDVPVAWGKEMAAYLKASDPYRHLVTNSASTVGPADVWRLPEMDLTQTHRYGDEGSIRDIAPGLPDDVRAHDGFAKPHLLGEFGISWRGSDDKFDPRGVGTNLHNGLWASALAGNAGTAMIWWWDSYVHPKHLYGAFTGIARFAKTIDWPRRRFEPVNGIPAPLKPQIGPETLTNLVLTPNAGWGDKASGTVTVEPDGTTRGGKILSTLMGPDKPEIHAPLTLAVDLPQPSRIVVHVATVSARGKLTVSVDGRTVGAFALDPTPAGAGTYESTKQFPEYGGIYQAVFNKDFSVAVPAGKHTIALENVDGDWLSLGPITLENARSSRFAALKPYALTDAASGETIVWLQDPESNWFNDRENRAPATFTGVRLQLPVPKPGIYTVRWWDTRRGVVVKTETVSATGDRRLPLTVPAFTRDIALRATKN